MAKAIRIQVIDSHTGGEPTRVIVAGGPDLGCGTMAERLRIFQRDFDRYRSAVVNEPRGSDVVVGALLCKPIDPKCAAGVIFFNNVGYLGMCGHGTIGLAVTLSHMGRIGPGEHRIETPVGVVSINVLEDGSVRVANVPSYRTRHQVEIEGGHGDVAWGGNWFFLVNDHGLQVALENVEQLTSYAWKLRRALAAAQITGDDGAEIDHIELFGPPSSPHADSRNFVLCPGGAYDRSPCGTGTSAKLACLAEDGKLAAGQIYRQESIVGSVFEASYTQNGERIQPTIRGRAWVTAEATLLLDPADPFGWGIHP